MGDRGRREEDRDLEIREEDRRVEIDQNDIWKKKIEKGGEKYNPKKKDIEERDRNKRWK